MPWVELAKTVFDQQVSRWDTETCDGGLRWMIAPFNNGYDYKNVFTNALFFQLGARLARYTGNTTYLQYVEQSYDWLVKVGLVDVESWRVFDGANVLSGCESPSPLQWTANTGILLGGAGVMYNLVCFIFFFLSLLLNLPSPGSGSTVSFTWAEQ